MYKKYMLLISNKTTTKYINKSSKNDHQQQQNFYTNFYTTLKFSNFSIFCLIFLIIFVTSNKNEANGFFIGKLNNNKKPGLMKLCPPGGESFATAWQITCGMRRKKRDLIEQQGLILKIKNFF